MRRANSFLVAVALSFVGGYLSAEAAPEFYIAPYVNSVDGTSAKILWVSEAGVAAGEVAIDGGPTAAATTAAIPGRTELLHVAPVTGLTAFTAYDYTVTCGSETADGSFHTAATGAVPFKFVIYGDPQGQGDGVPATHAQSVADAIAAEGPHLVVCAGDLVKDGEQFFYKGEFFDPSRAMLGQATFWTARGNHEERDDEGSYFPHLFRFPSNGVNTESYYSFDFANAHFVVLDSHTYKESYSEAQKAEMRAWLQADLAASQKEWTIAVFHHPPFDFGWHRDQWGREEIVPILEQGGVDFVMSGHSHMYQRCVPIGPAGEKPMHYIITGGGGGSLLQTGNWPYQSPSLSPIVVNGAGKGIHHYCLFEVDGDTLTMTAKEPGGTVIDQLTLVKTDGQYQAGAMQQAIDTDKARTLQFAFARLK